jgi:hypothetical protein
MESHILPDSDSEHTSGWILEENDEFLRLSLGDDMMYEHADGSIIIQKDYKVDGEIWQVHKTDVDPHPSWPHAHCVGGRVRFLGLKLHLGTRQLFHGPNPTVLFLSKKPFARLLELIRPKFPTLVLPIPGCEPLAASSN